MQSLESRLDDHAAAKYYTDLICEYESAGGYPAEADVLLLDEPTNHLDITAREWLEDQLSERNQACVVVSHDRSFLRRVATCMVEIQQSLVSIFPPSYDEYRSRRALLEQQAWDNYEAFERRKVAAELASTRRARLAVQVGTVPAGARSSHDFYWSGQDNAAPDTVWSGTR